MEIFLSFLFLFGGFALLWKSAEVLVSGAVSLSKRIGVSPLVVGLTVVAMGTSAPELATSITAAVRGAGDIAVGNVYGSNIANLALVGGIIAFIRPVRIRKRLVMVEIPVMVIVALLLWPLLSDFSLSRLEGVILLVIFAGLICLTIYFARRESKGKSKVIREVINTSAVNEVKAGGVSLVKAVVYTLLGLGGVALGADLAIRGAVVIGARLGLSEAVIGLSIVAVGTSLPELVTCLVATIKGHDEISVGNLVGSNIFNTLLVTGTAGAVRPFSIGGRLAGTDYLVMVGVSVLFGALAIFSRQRVGRKSGAILLAGYVLYMIYVLGFTAGN